MRRSARERTIIMFMLIGTEDSFEQDDWFLQYIHYGAEFKNARDLLRQMNLNETELAYLKKQGELTNETVPVQERIVNHARLDETEEAQDLLMNIAIPGQNKVFTVLHDYQQMISEDMLSVADEITQRTKTSAVLILSIGSLAFLVGIATAVYTIRRAASTAKELYIEKELAQVTLSSISEAVITTDAHGLIRFMNSHAEHLTGYQLHKSINTPVDNILILKADSNTNILVNPIVHAIESNRSISTSDNTILVNAELLECAIELTADPIRDLDDQVHGAVVIFRDVSENRELALKLHYQASHDALTGLVNRREFEIRLEKAVSKAQQEDIQYSLCYLDLDQFKIINDIGGHTAGDELLRQLSKVFKTIIRETDTLARLGGDEFGILLESCHLQKAEDIAENIRNATIKYRFYWEGEVFEIGVSIGIILIDKNTSSADEVMSSVDSACYLAKDRGRNRVEIYEPNNAEISERRKEMHWSQRISLAIADNKLHLFYQEIVATKNNDDDNVKHYEVLLRIIEDDKYISPDAFIQAAERYSLSREMDKWVVKNTFKILTNDSKYNSNNNIYNINLSGLAFNSTEMLDFILKEFETSKMDPNRICFEITETTAIANLYQAKRFISVLKNIGCTFALDDFGKGISSFNYLKHIPVDYIKIDGSFVRDIIDDELNNVFIESITKIAHVLKIKTVAEFVENENILNAVKKAGVDYAQGYYYSEPQAF